MKRHNKLRTLGISFLVGGIGLISAGLEIIPIELGPIFLVLPIPVLFWTLFSSDDEEEESQ